MKLLRLFLYCLLGCVLVAKCARADESVFFAPKINDPLPFALNEIQLADAWQPWKRFHNADFKAFIVEQKKPPRFWFKGTSTETLLRFSPAPTALTFMWGRGSIVLNLRDGSVKLNNVALDEAGFAFWSRIVECFPGVRAAMLGVDP